MIIPKLASALAYGGDYNPEQWPESVWRDDAALMREAGVNLVTLGVFSWSRLQPAENSYTFDWLDRVMDLMAEHGIFVDLATGTASPPPWLSAHHPDVLAVDAIGAAYHVGSRQHYSPSSPTYRRFAAALVRQMAKRYGRHPALAAWHINNEFGCHVPECHGAATTTAFRTWLRAKYRTLAALNESWGTAFWSQGYGAWEQIQTPRRTPTFSNPTQQLDFRRFTSDAILDLLVMEKQILQAVTPDVPVTTNFMGFFKTVDARRWARELDFVSWDNYPDPLPGRGGACYGAAGHDLTRSLKKDRPFALMEQSTSGVSWRPVNGGKPPGLMRLWSLQALARGADAILFFQWRTSRYGAEKFLGGMVPHAPAARSRVFAEVKALGAELKRLAPVAGSRVKSRVAIVFDWAAWWAVEHEPATKPARIDYAGWAQELHAYFFRRNLAVDFIAPGEALGDYALVVAPALYLLTRADADNLSAYVRGGGHLLATYFSGIVDERDHVVTGGYPAWLRETLGLWVEEWFPLAPEETAAIRLAGRRTPLAGTHWREAVHLEGAEALATFHDDDFLHRRPAFTRHRFGTGLAYYLATKPDRTALELLLDEVVQAAGVQPPLAVPAGVEATLRASDRASFLFLLNHGPKAVRIALGERRGRDLLTSHACRQTLSLEAMGVAVIELTG